MMVSAVRPIVIFTLAAGLHQAAFASSNEDVCSLFTSKKNCRGSGFCEWNPYFGGCRLKFEDTPENCGKQNPRQCKKSKYCTWDDSDDTCVAETVEHCPRYDEDRCEKGYICTWYGGAGVCSGEFESLDLVPSCSWMGEDRCNDKPGCQWNQHREKCMQKVKLDIPENCPIMDEKRCRKSTVCAWQNEELGCRAVETCDDSLILHDRKKCDKAGGCKWDDETAACVEVGQETVSCGDLLPGLCKRGSECWWDEDLDTCLDIDVVVAKIDDMSAHCQAFTVNPTKCALFPTCRYYKTGPLSVEPDYCETMEHLHQKETCDDLSKDLCGLKEGCEWHYMLGQKAKCGPTYDLSMEPCTKMHEDHCNEAEYCTWFGRRCDYDFKIDPSLESVENCAAVPKKRFCLKKTGCMWSDTFNGCLDEEYLQEMECDAFLHKHECKAAKACHWPEDGCEKKSEFMKDVKCEDIHRTGECRKRVGCKWKRLELICVPQNEYREHGECGWRAMAVPTKGLGLGGFVLNLLGEYKATDTCDCQRICEANHPDYAHWHWKTGLAKCMCLEGEILKVKGSQGTKAHAHIHQWRFSGGPVMDAYMDVMKILEPERWSTYRRTFEPLTEEELNRHKSDDDASVEPIVESNSLQRRLISSVQGLSYA